MILSIEYLQNISILCCMVINLIQWLQLLRTFNIIYHHIMFFRYATRIYETCLRNEFCIHCAAPAHSKVIQTWVHRCAGILNQGFHGFH